MFNFNKISQEFIRIKATSQWQDLIDKFKNASDIGYIGHGGNLAIADHAAIDALPTTTTTSARCLHCHSDYLEARHASCFHAMLLLWRYQVEPQKE